jgi:hypothetical protein
MFPHCKGGGESVLHETMVHQIAHARAHKQVFCGVGSRLMCPLLTAYDAAGELLLDAVIVPKAGTDDARDAALIAADRVVRGLPAHRIVLKFDVFRPSQSPIPAVVEGSVQRAHSDGWEFADEIDEAIVLFSIDRQLNATRTELPYQWNRQLGRAGLMWFPEDDSTTAVEWPRDPEAPVGHVLRVLRQIMLAGLLADDPKFLAEMRAGGFDDIDRDSLLTAVARSVLAGLSADQHILRIPEDRFGSDIIEFIHRSNAPPPALTPEKVRELLMEMGDDVRQRNVGDRFAPPSDSPNRPSRPSARERAEARKKKRHT